MTILSVPFLKNPLSKASCADVATFAIAIFKNASCSFGICTSPSKNESDKRSANSFIPPPPGTKPTPTSTSPM